MPDQRKAPIFFFAPFVSSTMRVEPQWIDYNGHLNMAYYHVLFDRAVDEAFELVGLGPNYAEVRKASFVVAEIHTRYRRELKADDSVRVTLQLLGYDEKRLHTYLEIRHATEGWVASTSENLSLHVDLGSKQVTPFPDDILANLAIMEAAHARLSRPEAIGRVIGLRPREPGESKSTAGTRH